MPPLRFTTRPQIEGTFGVVTSTHWIATAVGMSILERGGNAFDAAVATAFVLQIVEPHLNGPGGDVPIILYDVRRGKPEVICGQGTAPGEATVDRFRALGLDAVPGTGLLAACVPGTFETWMLLLRDYGSMPLADVLEPAIHYAESGHPVVEKEAEAVESVRELFLNHWATSAETYLVGEAAPAIGDIVSNRKLAQTYRRLLHEAGQHGGDRDRQIEHARQNWSQGFVAEAIDRFSRTQSVMDVTGRRHSGLLSGQDMALWQPTIEPPLSIDYHGHTVCKAGPWSQAPVMLQQLALIKQFDLKNADAEDPAFIHLLVECSKLAYADREKFYGDPNFAEVPMERLLSAAYNAERAGLVTDTASLELRPGDVDGLGLILKAPVSAAPDAQARSMGVGEPTVGRMGQVRGDTVHFDVIDRHGNMISATPSGGWLQSSPVIPDLGFCLGTRAQMFWLDERHPAGLRPRARPRTTLSPTLAFRQGEPYLAWGTPGGDQQDQWTAQFFLRHVHCGMNLQEAIDAPAWHSEHFPISFWPRHARPGVLVVENRVPAAAIADLERRGHIVEIGPAWSEGRLTAASRVGSKRFAAANPRGMQGYAIGR